MFKKENYTEMLCPVCKDFYFTTLEDDKMKNLGYFSQLVEKYSIKTDIPQCHRCGWKYDSEQHEDPELKHGENKLSLREYRNWYSEQLKKDPEFNYLESQYIPQPHICPICGKYEFDDINSHDICIFCGWEDDGLMESEPDLWAGCANDLCLNDFKKRYIELTTKNKKYKYTKNHYGEN